MPSKPVLPAGTPRQEMMLQEENRKQQHKIYELERLLQEQNARLVAQDHRRPIEGGSCSVHLSQAAAHASQAVAAACNYTASCCTSICAIHSRPQQVEAAETPKKSQRRHVKHDIPTWASATDYHLVKQARIAAGGVTIRFDEQRSHQPALQGPDALQEHEYVLEDELPNVACLINPKSSWKETWDIGVLVFILYSAIVVPIRICFSAEAEGYMWDFEVAISLFFITDCIFNFNTAYHIEDKWVISRKRIAMNYLAGWFWIDAPSSLPVEIITALMHNAGGNGLSLLRFLRMFRLLRLLKLLKVEAYISVMEDKFEVNLVSLRVLGMVIKLMFMVHMLGCFWFYVAATAEEAGEEVTWVMSYDGGSAYDAPVSKQYVYSVYWSLTTLTTIGYGDITPTNMHERYYCLFAMLIGALMFGYMLSTIGSMVSAMDRQAAAFEERMDMVKDWMMTRNMPRKLLIRVRKYYEHYYTRKSAFDEDEIVRGLTPALRSEVTAILLRDSLGHFPLLNVLGTDFQLAVYPRLKPVSYAHHDVVYTKGSSSEDIYFLRKGQVDVLAGGPGTNVLYRVTAGQYFGEEALTHERRGCSILSNGWCEMWLLSRDVLDETLAKFPSLQSKLEKFFVAELERKSRLYALSYRILISMATDPKYRAALIVQKVWTQFAASKARAYSRYAASFGPGLPDLSSKPTSSKARPSAEDDTPKGMAAAIKQLQLQLSKQLPQLQLQLAGPKSSNAKGATNEAMAATLRQIQKELSGLKQEVKSIKMPSAFASKDLLSV